MIKHEASDALKALVAQYHPDLNPYFLLTNQGDLIVCFDYDAVPLGESQSFMPRLIAGKTVLVSPYNFKQKLDKIDKQARLVRQKEASLAAEAQRQPNLAETPSIWS
jgi:hypothetical protein